MMTQTPVIHMAPFN